MYNTYTDYLFYVQKSTLAGICCIRPDRSTYVFAYITSHVRVVCLSRSSGPLRCFASMNIDTPPDSRAPQPPSSVDPPITQCLAYLQSPSDTSRFVGLIVLSSILKNQNVAQDRMIVQKLWDSMPYKFLDRLLISRMPSH